MTVRTRAAATAVGLFNNIADSRMYLVDGILDIFGTAGRDKRVQWLILGRQRSTVFEPDFTFLH